MGVRGGKWDDPLWLQNYTTRYATCVLIKRREEKSGGTGGCITRNVSRVIYDMIGVSSEVTNAFSDQLTRIPLTLVLVLVPILYPHSLPSSSRLRLLQIPPTLTCALWFMPQACATVAPVSCHAMHVVFNTSSVGLHSGPHVSSDILLD